MNTILLKCPHCPKDNLNGGAGLNLHIMRTHRDKWKGGLENSIPAGYMSRMMSRANSVPAVAKRGQKKAPIPMTCPSPGCGYRINHPPAMRRHILSHHPAIWKGNLTDTLGTKMSSRNRLPRKQRLANKNSYNRRFRASNILKGLTGSGRPRSRQAPAWLIEEAKRILAEPVKTQGRASSLSMPTSCAICGSKYRNRSSLGTHVRTMHKKSLFELPPYKTEVDEVVEKFDRGEPVLQHFDTSRTEVKEPSETTVTIADGKTNVTITTRFGLKELVNYILET